jgi:PAS domain S-box-containing protein
MVEHFASTVSLPYRWLKTHTQWTNSLILMSIAIIGYELLWQSGFYYEVITKNTFGLVMLTVIVVAGFRYGLRPALLMAIMANAYTYFAYAAPGRNIATINSLMNGEWFIVIVFFGPAIVVGYLRERVNELLARERLARSQAEQEQVRLTTILEQLPVGVVIADAASGNVIFGNQYLEQLLGHSSSNTEQEPGRRRVPLEEWPLKQVLQGQTLSNEEYSYIHNGHSHVLRINGTPIYYQGNITAGAVIIDDVTNEKELEQRKDDFLSMVSHELKTPLTSLKMYLQLAAKQLGEIGPTPARSLAKAEAQADKLNQLVNDMLVLARTQANKMEYRFEVVDLHQFAKQIIDDVQPNYPNHRLLLQGKKHLSVLADCDRLGQVVINLIANAVKYAPEADKVIITTDQYQSRARLSVQDFGIGIDPAEQKRIFERFYQTATSSNPGLGIGLYLATEIVKSPHG